MGKYLELFRGEVGDLTEKTKLENKPYVAYSTKLGKVTYTVVPAKDPVVEGPADNEIWYTSSDGNVVTPYTTNVFGANIVSNTYEDAKGIIKFDNSVTSIGDNAFYGCSPLTSVTIPNSVTFITDSAFSSCTSLASMVIPDGVVGMGMGAFQYCSSLTSIVIPASMRNRNDYVFYGCTSLTSITFKGTVEQWNSMYEGEYWNRNVPATYVQCTDGQVAL